MSPRATLNRFVALDRFADTIRILLALSAVTLYTAVTDHNDQLIPLMLGVIAAGIAETDDSWRARARALTLTLACFSTAALTVELLVEREVLFAPALALGSFGLVMLGAASVRYATIGRATLLLAIYTMIGVSQHTGPARAFWVEPALLVAGAGGYGLLALAWQAIFVHRPVRQSLARLYDALSAYLSAKAALFEPSGELDVAARRAGLAHENARVVAALNDTRLALIDRLSGRRSRSAMQANLQFYLAAQDIHERASSAHYPYQRLRDTFFHSDVMFRAQRLLHAIGGGLTDRAASLRYGQAPAAGASMRARHDELVAAIDYWHAHQKSLPRGTGDAEALAAARDIATNLHALIDRVADDGPARQDADTAELADPQPDSALEAGRRILAALTPASARFRHALRLSIALLAGYGLFLAIHPAQGYWILLTTLLVCQPDYAATRKRLVQRIGGTLAGLVVGWALLRLFPVPEMQFGLIVVSGAVFFATRFRRYFVAAAAISVLVLLSFEQVGSGYDLILPRLVDTLIGGGLAALVMLFVWPDWRERELHHRLAEALRAHGAYLRALHVQYIESGRADDLAYRVARRASHNAEASLASHVATALADAHGDRADNRCALEVLATSQTMIGHLSALGAHRQRLAGATPEQDTLTRAIEHIADAWEHMGDALIRGDDISTNTREAALYYDAVARLADAPAAEPAVRRLAYLLTRLFDELAVLRDLSQRLTAGPSNPNAA